MAVSDYVQRFLAGQGMGGTPVDSDSQDVVRRFLRARGRLRDDVDAADTAEVQRRLAAQAVAPSGLDESVLDVPVTRSQKTSPAAAAPTAEDADYNARRAAASRTALVNDVLSGATEGFDRATEWIAGPGPGVRARDRNAVANAEAAFAKSEEERRLLAQRAADKPLTDARKAAELEKLKADTAKAKASTLVAEGDAAYEAALRDINSPETQAFRDQAVAISGGKLTPERAARLNGIQLREAVKTATSQLNAEAMAGIQRDRLQQSATEAAKDRGLRIAALEQAERLATLSREQAYELAKLRLEEEQEKRKAAEAKADEGRAFKMGEREVGGFRIKEGRIPSADSAKQLRDLAIESGKIEYSLKRLDDLYAKHGTELFGRYAGEMESEFMAISNALRVMNNMGVPNGRDYEMLEKELADPTTRKSLFTSRGRTQAKLKALGERVRNTVDLSADKMGYEREGAVPRVAPSGSMVQVDDLPTNNPAPAAQAAPRPITKPTIAPGEVIPRLIDTSGLKSGELREMLEEGEVVRIPWRLDDGTAGYRDLKKVTRNGKPKLILLKEGK